MRLVTWNVTAGGGKATADQIAALVNDRPDPDVVALQEVRATTVRTHMGYSRDTCKSRK